MLRPSLLAMALFTHLSLAFFVSVSAYLGHACHGENLFATSNLTLHKCYNVSEYVPASSFIVSSVGVAADQSIGFYAQDNCTRLVGKGHVGKSGVGDGVQVTRCWDVEGGGEVGSYRLVGG